jgi:hypothetical protein
LGTERLGPWSPLSLAQTVGLFDNYPSRWWITGGRALELHLGRTWRSHEDSDVSVRRDEVAGILVPLAGWDIHLAAAGRLSPWAGQAAHGEEEQNNLWCRRHNHDPWCLDVTISDGDDRGWVYRRDPNIRVPWDRAVLFDAEGIPYLAPELQLLFKSKNFRPKDQLDAEVVIPELDADRQSRLRDLLPETHPWLLLMAQ